MIFLWSIWKIYFVHRVMFEHRDHRKLIFVQTRQKVQYSSCFLSQKYGEYDWRYLIFFESPFQIAHPTESSTSWKIFDPTISKSYLTCTQNLSLLRRKTIKIKIAYFPNSWLYSIFSDSNLLYIGRWSEFKIEVVFLIIMYP